MKKHSLLGAITPAVFLRDYWHKKPLLIRQAFPAFAPILDRDALFAMAADDAIESRLVTRTARQWDMQNGPLTSLPPITQKRWTMLLQGVNLHLPAADALLRQFRFLPDARLDDLMISYATDGGGVGPHVDSYDVFLLQAQGQRRWRISAQKDQSFIEGAPLKILKNFQPEEEYVLEPGDMLYLPPDYAHEGVALGECMTYSIGFRAPTFQELGVAFLQFMADTIDLPGRYADPDLTLSKHPAEIGKPMLEQVTAELNKLQFTEEDITIFLGQHLSEPKASVFFDPPRRTIPRAAFLQKLGKTGIALSPRTLMLYRNRHLFINGESFALSREDRAVLTVLADTRRLAPELASAGSTDVLDALLEWYHDGWLIWP
ncbi:cupin domain-containing protein [Herbaspirillum sp. RTI4]|uniref:cupin domain-containing protein n=1 Tax=Herbaspirillum sp. RTI4 TaxID=3048640 RepID=UPI002AB5D07F|nr:cupin domain-containing protein [Herbaspirillum sp. RTI4]MDY7578059.1 cupin domain-containing protein [Herbaspirillum sp. RTI4]MEA9983189.1 cupin domain-containing protein [Herbaspirillum sp. RTI4]